MKEIILIRHGATAGNLERRYIGRTDEPLCEQGRLQALWLQQQGLHVDALLVSPALRARQTAQLAFPAMSYQVIPEWRETDFGIFEGKTAQEMEEDSDYRAWVDSGCRGPVPGGEQLAEFQARCCAGFRRIEPLLPPDIHTAWVIHGGVIMALLEAYARPARNFYDYHIGNGGYVRCSCREGILHVEEIRTPE